MPSELAIWCGTLLMLAAGSTTAAPLDTLLTVTPERALGSTAWVELAVDRLNRRLDFGGPAAADASASGQTRNANGDYQSKQVVAAYRVADGLWLSGSAWQRQVRSDADTYHYRGWRVSGLYRLADAAHTGAADPAAAAWSAALTARPALALRLSAWGNEAKLTETTTPVHVTGAVLDTVTVTRPSDLQLQADLIATWRLSPSVDFSAALGAGRIRLAYAGLAATTTRNGCHYGLSFNGNDIFGTLAQPCSAGAGGGGVIQQFYDSSGDYGVDVAHEIAWKGSFLQAGVNVGWHSGPWTLQGGYLFHAVRRDAVDAILAARGDPVHKTNQTVTLEAAYQVHAHVQLFTRAELSSNLFFQDLPVTYNSSTSGNFGSRLSMFTLGLRAGF
ncbi:hypothetical protein ACVBEH_16055 [Roseateles sp. GG27B]